MYKTTSDHVRTIASSILAASGNMSKDEALKALFNLDPSKLRQLSKAVVQEKGTVEAGSLPAFLSAALLALTILMPKASAQEQASMAEELADTKEQIAKVPKGGEMIVTSIAGVKLSGPRGSIQALLDLDKQMAGKVRADDRKATIEFMAEQGGLTIVN